jgi:hypothetical protein
VAPIPGLTDIAGLAEILLSRIPELADECISDPHIAAICELEACTLRHLADATATCLPDFVLKAEVLVARLVTDSAEVQILDGEAALLRSLLRDLSSLADAMSRNTVGTNTAAGSDGDHAAHNGHPLQRP